MLRVRTVLLVPVACAAMLLSACDSGNEAGGTGGGLPDMPPLTEPSLEAPGSSASAAPSLTPVRKVFDTQRMQNDVERILTESYEVKGLERVDCPPEQPVKAGQSFDCVAQIEGSPKHVEITVVNADGQYEVGLPREGE